MMGKSHLKIGIGISLPTANPIIIIGSIIGSLLPDIDHENSYISNMLMHKHRKHRILKHRGFTHSIIALICVYVIFYYIGTPTLALGVSIGYLSHLIADMCTPCGIPLLWPCNKKFRIMTIKTNSFIEKIIAYIILFAGIIKLGGKIT